MHARPEDTTIFRAADVVCIVCCPIVLLHDQQLPDSMASPQVSILDCSICYEPFQYDVEAKVPRVLHCGHSFCTADVMQFKRAKGSSLPPGFSVCSS